MVVLQQRMTEKNLCNLLVIFFGFPYLGGHVLNQAYGGSTARLHKLKTKVHTIFPGDNLSYAARQSEQLSSGINNSTHAPVSHSYCCRGVLLSRKGNSTN